MEPKWMVFIIVSFGMFATTLEGTIVLVVYPMSENGCPFDENAA